MDASFKFSNNASLKEKKIICNEVQYFGHTIFLFIKVSVAFLLDTVSEYVPRHTSNLVRCSGAVQVTCI